MHLRSRPLTLTLFAVFGVLVATLVVVWLLVVSGNMCIARTHVAPPEELLEDPVHFKDEVERMKKDAEGALVRAFDSESDFFLYEAHPDGTIYDRDNDIRQFLASRLLALKAGESEEVQSLHEQNLSTIMREWYREEGEIGYVYAYEKSKLGANALLLRVLVASPFFPRYEKEAKKLAASIRSIQNSDGSFRPWLKEPGYAYDSDYLLTFYSGEAILALLEYFDKTHEEEWLQAATKAQDFYVGEYVDRLEENYYPAYVPWHTLSLANLYEKTKNETYRDAIFTLTDELLLMQDQTQFVGRFYNDRTPQYGSPHVSSDAVYTEGLGVAYALAKSAGDRERSDRYYRALVYAFHNLRGLQFEGSLFRVFDERGMANRLRGGMRTNACSHTVRIDSTAHTIDSLNSILRAL